MFMKKRILTLALAAALLLTPFSLASASGTAFVADVPEQLPAAGESFTVSVSLTGNPGFNSIQFRLAYDDTVVQCDEVENGAVLAGTLSASNPHATGDGVGAMVSAASLDAVTSDGEIAQFQFTVLRAGTAGFSLEDVSLTDVDGTELPFSASTQASGAGKPGVPPPADSADDEGTNTGGVNTGDANTGSGGNAGEETPTQPEETGQDIAQTAPASFSDVPDTHWAYSSVAEAAGLGLIAGFEDGSFRPDQPVTRGQFVVILWRMAGSPETDAAADFADVAPTAWYAKAVAWANENGFVNGVSAQRFDPDGNITREQAVTILHRYAGTPSGMEGMLSGIYDSQFTDSGSISPYAKNAVYWAVYHSIVTGMTETTIAPQQTATRAQITVIFLRYINQNK